MIANLGKMVKRRVLQSYPIFLKKGGKLEEVANMTKWRNRDRIEVCHQNFLIEYLIA